EPPMPIYTGQPVRPEINGPRVVGCTPGMPFLFRVPVAGVRPMSFSATGLPTGLTLNGDTGVISGTIRGAGTYTLDLSARNAKGAGSRQLAILCGDHKLALTPPMGWNSWNVW